MVHSYSGTEVGLLFAIIVMAIGIIVPIGSRYYIMQIEEARNLTWVICGGAIFCLLYFARTLVNVLFYRALDKFGGAYMSHLSLLLEKSVQESKYERVKENE